MDMAVSRIGGSGGKMKGQVGSVIYQIKKGSGGRFIQYAYAKGERTEGEPTPRLQVQRMCMAMIQSIMRDLQPVVTVSFEGRGGRAQSLGEFSKVNLSLVMEDCRHNWDGGNKFIYPAHHRSDLEIKDLGGVFVISSGSLAGDLFDAVLYDEDPALRYKGVPSVGHELYGIYFNIRVGVATVSEFLEGHDMTFSDRVVFAGFRDWFQWREDVEESTEFYRNDYIIASLDMAVRGGETLTEEVVRRLFKLNASMEASIYFRRDGSGFTIGHLCDVDRQDEAFYYQTAFSISMKGGRKRLSSSVYTAPDGSDEPWLLNAKPANVFGSWMGTPQIRPYPSPFDNVDV